MCGMCALRQQSEVSLIWRVQQATKKDGLDCLCLLVCLSVYLSISTLVRSTLSPRYLTAAIVMDLGLCALAG